MDIEQKYYKLPDIPSGKPGQSWWGKKYASTTDDLLEYTEYLRIIFNSPSLCIQDFIYDEMDFDKDIKRILQKKAQSKLDALITIANKTELDTVNMTRKNPKALLKKQYQTLYRMRFKSKKLTISPQNKKLYVFIGTFVFVNQI